MVSPALTIWHFVPQFKFSPLLVFTWLCWTLGHRIANDVTKFLQPVKSMAISPVNFKWPLYISPISAAQGLVDLQNMTVPENLQLFCH